MPGRIFWRPSVTTRSPGARPPVTSQSLPIARSRVMAFWSTLPSAPSTMAKGSPFGLRRTACWVTSMACSFTPSSTTARTNIPGSSVPSGLGKTMRRITEAVDGSTDTSRNWRVPSKGYFALSPRIRLTFLPSVPSLVICLDSSRFCRRSKSVVDCGTSTYMGSICWIVASGVGW